MEVAGKVKEFIKDILAVLQSAKLYSTAHKKFAESVDTAYKALQAALAERSELIIGVIGDDFAFESEIFFEFALLPLAQEIMASLKRNEIEKIIFNTYVHKNEFDAFINYLAYIQGKTVQTNGKEQLAALGIKNISIELLTTPLSKPKAGKDKAKTAFNEYVEYLNKISKYLEMFLNNQEIDYISLKLDIFSIKDNLIKMRKVSGLAYAKIRPVTAVMHSVNVSIQAMHFALRLGFAKDELLETAIAALLHDIGRFHFFQKTRKQINITNHYEKGSALLLKYRRNLGELPVLVSFEHHLRHDLKGPPKLWFDKYKPHLISELVHICDVYETLFQRRSLKYDHSPDAIYKLMIRGKGSAFHPVLLDIFFRITGVWPVGTIVLLNDSRVAIVSDENDNDIFRPKITLFDFNAGKVIDLKDTQGLKIEKALNPLGEGKDYFDLLDLS